MANGWRESYYRYKNFFLNISELYRKKANLRAFLEIMLSISTITVFLLFALKPTVITIINLSREIKEKKDTLAGLTQKVNDLQVARGLLNKNQSSIPNINIAIASLPNPDTFSGQVLALASKDSVELVGVSVNQIVLAGTGPNKISTFKAFPSGAKEMPFSINVRGSFANLTAFIKDFEKLRVISKIDTLGINSSLTDTGLVIVAVISGRVPFTGN